MPSLPTIKDVARLSGVSIGTVDRVLHNRGRVSKETQEAVHNAVKALNYFPSQIGRALAIQKREIRIGVSCMDVEHDFWEESMTGILYAANRLRPFGAEVVVDRCPTYDAAQLKESILRLISQDVNGLMLTPVNGSNTWLDDLIPQHIPYATVIDDSPLLRRLFHIGPDDYAMGRLAAKLSLLYSHQPLQAVVLSPNVQFSGTKKRVSGYIDMLKQEGQRKGLLEICTVPGESEKKAYEAVYESALKAIQTYPLLNSIYVTNGLTQWVAAAVKAVHLDRKIHVFGHEYTSMTGDFVREGYITATIYQRPAQQWNMAVHLLFDHISGVSTPASPDIITESSIVMMETLPFAKIGISNPI